MLKIEHNSRKVHAIGDLGNVMVTPPIGADYWTMRVPLSDKQAIVCFPKFGTIGIGFQSEAEDWNTNLPYTCGPKEIFDHIKINKGDDTITDADCLAAIRMLQEAIHKTMEHSA